MTFANRFDPLYHPHPAWRVPAYARRGMVATSQPLAAQAGLDMLKRGGNAIDAAIAAAAALTVVEPCANGIGGDAFALVWTGGKLHGLNASGPASRNAGVEAVRAAGCDSMPTHGALPVNVPGAPAAWAELSRRFGKLALADALEPAIRYAAEGYPVSPTVALNWGGAFASYRKRFASPEFAAWFDTFAPGGRAPAAGGIWASPDHARTLRLIGESDGEAFYRGELAERIGKFMREARGFVDEADLAAYRPEWVEPIGVRYRGYDVWEIPPNGQGLVALLALNILGGFDDLRAGTADTVHRQLEAMKLAFADGKMYITDPRYMKTSVRDLLSDSYAASRRALIGGEAAVPAAGKPQAGGTVYLAAADGEGNMISYIQSNYMGFGSGLVVPGTGIALANRGSDFSLDPNAANVLAPGKKTYHTIIPGFLTRGAEAVGPFGVMGGYMQPQGHVQAVMNLLDFDLHPQAALDAPRWQWIGEKMILMEHSFPAAVAQALTRRGHDIRLTHDSGAFGRGQIILRDPDTGVLCGGTESRTDGAVAVW